MLRLRPILAAVLVACAAVPVAAQVGGLRVTVTAPDGAPLPGATVTLGHATGNVKTTSERTDAEGSVAFPVLRPGKGYVVVVDAAGYASVRLDDLRVRIDTVEPIVVRMVESFSEQVRIDGYAPAIDLDKTETSTRFTDEFIGDLPVAGRFYQQVLTLAPGVQDSDGDGNPNVHGSRSRDFQALVGGVSNVDPLTGQWMSRINPNSIEEMEIITAGAGVEFGRAQGGFARIVQKQGSNVHEGLFELYWQSSELDGSGGPDPGGAPPPDFETVQPLFQFSGPIVRDRLWYRASYERRDREEPVNVATGFGVYANDTETRDVQVTWQASPRNKLAFSYRSDPAEERNFGISSTLPVESSRRRDRDVETFGLTWTAPYSPRVLVDTTVAWQELNIGEGPVVPGATNQCVPGAEETFLREAQCRNLMNGRQSGAFHRSEDDFRQRFTLKTHATAFLGRFWGADHRIKTGISIENERYFRSLTRTANISYYEVTIPSTSLTSPPEEVGIAATRVAVPESDDVRALGTNWGIYLEDRIKPRHDLTITAGLRVDREEVRSEGRAPVDTYAELDGFEADPDLAFPDLIGFVWPRHFTGYEAFDAFAAQLQTIVCDGVAADTIGNCFLDVAESILGQDYRQLYKLRRARDIDLTNTNVSPFLSVAWSPGSDGKTAIKLAAGRHYNNIPLVIPLQELEPIRTDLEYRVTLANQDTNVKGGITPKFNVSTVDHDLRTPYQDEVTVSLERELWPETSLHLTWIRREFRDQIQDRNVNVNVDDYGKCLALGEAGVVVPSPGGGPGSGIFLVDQFTGETYEDTDPGDGDGRLDDCTGLTFFIDTDPKNNGFGDDIIRLEKPDGFPDLYVQNPFWGDIFEIANVNEIDYEAFVLEFVRRQYRGWEMNASYTWSEAIGDGEDFFQELGNDPGLRPSTRGYQSYDQRHVVKINATTVTPWGIRLGAAVSWQSGLPYSVLHERFSSDTLPPTTRHFANDGLRVRQSYPTGERNDQRNASYWNVDVKATRELRVGKHLNLQLSAEIFNALDDDTYQIYNPFFEAGQQVNGVNEATRRFGRRWQLGMRVAF